MSFSAKTPSQKMNKTKESSAEEATLEKKLKKLQISNRTVAAANEKLSKKPTKTSSASVINRTNENLQPTTSATVQRSPPEWFIKHLADTAPDILRKSMGCSDQEKKGEKSTKNPKVENVENTQQTKKDRRFNSDLVDVYLRQRILEHRIQMDKIENGLLRGELPKKPHRKN